MKFLQSILTLIIFTSTLNAQTSLNYKFNFNAVDTSKYFSIDLPDKWLITTETKGTPYAIIGFEVSDSGTYQLNKCAKEMRIGIKVLNLNLEKSIESIGLFHHDSSNFYTFKDTDGYINIIVTSKSTIDNVDCMVFSINKLSDCPIVENKKTKKKKRTTTPKTYLLFSLNNTTVCIESFNGKFEEKNLSLIKSSFKMND